MPNAAIVNFAAGETAPKSRGRFDLPWYAAGARKLLNFIPESQGPVRFRPGFRTIGQTRTGAVARLIPFQLSPSRGYMLEFTPGFMRAYIDESVQGLPLHFIPSDPMEFDNFSDGDYTASPVWTPFLAARAAITSGKLVVTAFDPGGGVVGGAARAPSLSSGVTTGRYEFDGEITGDGHHMFAGESNLAYTTDANGVTSFAGDGYGIFRTGGGNYKLGRLDSGVFTSILDLGVSGSGEKHFRIDVTGGFVGSTLLYWSVYVDADFKGTVEDHAYTVASLFGILADTTAGNTTSIDNVRVPRFRIASYSGATFEIVGLTNASPAVLTTGTSELNDGDTIVVHGVEGMPEINGREFIIANSSGNTHELTDPTTGNDIDSSTWGAYTNGGWAALITESEVATPYFAEDLADLSWAFSARDGVMYLAHPKYAPRKLIVDGGDQFSLSTATLTNSPFSAISATLTIADIHQGESTIIEFNVGSVLNENATYTFSIFANPTQLNSATYRLRKIATTRGGKPRAYLVTTNGGAHVDSTDWALFNGSGVDTAVPDIDHPITVAFYEGRLGYFGTGQRPSAMFLSRAPATATGNPRYDDFTGGANADDATFFTLAPTNGRTDFIAWAQGTEKFLLVGTYGGVFRVSGGGRDEPITPTSVNVRQISSYGCEATKPAISGIPFFIQRGGTSVRASQFDFNSDSFETRDILLNAEHIANSRLQRIVLQVGRPDIMWVIREDGILAGMSLNRGESVTGWHRQKIAGTSAKVLDVQVLERSDKDDQLWAIIERTVNGVTRRTIEVMSDIVEFLDEEDFYSGENNQTADNNSFNNANYRRQEEYIHMDGAKTYDGSDRGKLAGVDSVFQAGANLTPSAVTGIGITLTASQNVFSSNDVGKEIWKKPDRITGVGAGKATITSVTNELIVVCTVTTDFDSVSAISAGDWYFTATTIYGLDHLEGETVAIVSDGKVIKDGLSDASPTTVSQGKITLTTAAAVVHVGLPYEGIVQTHNLEVGGQQGPAQAKPRNIVEMFIRFLSTLGVDYGTKLYDLVSIDHDNDPDNTDRPDPVFSGIKKLYNPDEWSGEGEKMVVLAQRKPLPCTVQSIDIRYHTADEL